MESLLHSQHYNRPTKWTMVILCNARSNGKAAKLVFNNFNILDMVSDEINFFLPGYETSDIHEGQSFDEINSKKQYLEGIHRQEYSDYHYNYPFDVVVSRRLGPILFDDASFANFVKELSLRCKGHQYSGSCELVLLPLREGTPRYEDMTNIPLDPLCENRGMSLDQFLHEVFNILRSENLNRTTFFSFLRRDRIHDRIYELYQHACHIPIESYSQHLEENLDRDILNHMRWHIGEPYFFISYSSEDTLEAMALRNCLEQEGHKVWIAPDGIPQGRDYISVIPASIRMSKRFILLLSQSSARSTWVRNEVSTAIGCRTTMNILLTKGYSIQQMRENESISFMLDGCQIKYRLEDMLCDESALRRFVEDEN